jgi:hypothetical protein
MNDVIEQEEYRGYTIELQLSPAVYIMLYLVGIWISAIVQHCNR